VNKKFVNFIKEYQSGKISAFDLYQNLPMDVQKSVEGSLLKAKADEEKEDESASGERDADDDIGDALYGDEKKDLNKQMGQTMGITAPPAPPGAGTGAIKSLGEISALRAPLRKSASAQKNFMQSQYGVEVVRKSGVGAPCMVCKKLHKSVGNLCDSCTDAMQSSVWHKNSHLE
jgi:hypothetical protein